MSGAQRVAIVGAHGQIARSLAGELVGRGHDVRGLVRSSDQFDDVRSDGAEPFLCDVETASADELDDALAGFDVVVFAAGAGPDSGVERKKSVDRDGAIHSVESAVRSGANRFLIVSSMGAGDPPADDETFSVYLRAKHDADVAVRAASERSGIIHTIIRPGRLTNDDGSAEVELSDTVARGEIPRRDVAALLAELISTERGTNRTLEVVTGSTPIAAAVAAVA